MDEQLAYAKTDIVTEYLAISTIIKDTKINMKSFMYTEIDQK
jgi:hypothetical protein